MDYKPCKTTCSTEGCGYLRRRGGRYCPKCHRERERNRRTVAREEEQQKRAAKWQQVVERFRSVASV